MLCSAVSFPAMVLFERGLPNLPPADRTEHEVGWYHSAKNYTTECLRADAQWWSKCLCFMVLVLAVVALV
jgi:hypothetical protein